MMPQANSKGSRLRRLGVRLAAEFGIVVLGVTVALWADGWVTEQRQRETEGARIAALGDNLRSTLADLREERESAAGAARALRHLVSIGQDVPGAEVREAVLYGFLYVPDFQPELNVYEDLKSSGELALLTDPELRRSLAAMDARLEGLRAAQSDVVTVQQLNFDTYLVSRVDLRSIMGDLLDLGPVDPGQVDLSFAKTLEFKNLAIFKLDLMVQIGHAFEEAEAALTAVHQLIDARDPLEAVPSGGSA